MRFGLLGTGTWARDVHAAALVTEPMAELAGVWGRNPGRTQAIADAWGVSAYAEVDQLLADVEAVAMAVPPDVQAGLAERSAAAGRHLLLDKPLALDLAAADRVVAAVAASSVASVVFFTLRYAPSVAGWLDASIALGPWDGVRAAWLSSFLHPADPPHAESPWRAERGALWDVGPHALSLTIPLLGAVTAVVPARGPGDTVHLALQHAGGASSTMTLSLTVPPAAATVELAMYGPTGWREMPAVRNGKVESLRAAIRQLVRTAKSGEHGHGCDVGFGREVVAVLQEAQEKLAGGQS